MANYGEYVVPKAVSLQNGRALPNSVQHAASSSSLSAHIPISAGQVVVLAREAMRNALGENQTQTTDGKGMDMRTGGVTIDLSHKRIQTFPDEVVDIIKNELERLALSHNQLSTFPARFAECTLLRYLNVRNNNIQEFPLSICELGSLEILDLGRNKLISLPPELSKLTSLKVLSVQKNRIESLPLCLADMTSLQVLKLDGNPLRFPPKEVLQPQASSPPNGAFQESEIDDMAVTSQIKRFLKQKAFNERSETESGGEESSEGTETPRPVKRVMSGRFPIKVNGTDMPDLRSPAMQRPPPIPSRSHYRGLSQQNAAVRRPGVLPLTIGSANERLRSNSESLLQANRDRSSDRSRRMGIVSRKASELTPVEELKANRISHFRGLSHGSAMGNANGVNGNQSPASPADPSQRSAYVRRLSSLPERKRQSTVKDPVVEAAEGILYALAQIHPQIQGLLGLARDGTNKRTSLERVFYNASTHVEELDRHVHAYMNQSEEDEDGPVLSNENLRQACISCVEAYIHICKLLPMNVQALLENGDPRYIRSLLLLIYGSCAEIRNASASLFKQSPMQMTEVPEEDLNQRTIRYPPRDKSITPTRERPGVTSRSRSATVVHHTGNLRVTTDVHGPYNSGAGRSATFTSATPRSGESFASSNASRMGDFSEDDRLFEKIFLRLQESTDMSVSTLPIVSHHFVSAMKTSIESANPDQPKQFWQVLIQKTAIALHATDSLKARMSSIKLKEPGIRTQSAFWILCNSFIQTYTDLVIKVKEAKSSTYHFPPVVIQHLRPLQKAIKECSQLIHTSPWASLTTPQTAHPSNGSYTLQSPASQVALPMTPQSAALGPAVQATVPSTPQGGMPYNSMFHGNVFERNDNYQPQNGDRSATSSRAGTMTSNLGPYDGGMGPNSMASPMMRYNGNSKMAF